MPWSGLYLTLSSFGKSLSPQIGGHLECSLGSAWGWCLRLGICPLLIFSCLHPNKGQAGFCFFLRGQEQGLAWRALSDYAKGHRMAARAEGKSAPTIVPSATKYLSLPALGTSSTPVPAPLPPVRTENLPPYPAWTTPTAYPGMTLCYFSIFINFIFYLLIFIWLCYVLALACGIF